MFCSSFLSRCLPAAATTTGERRAANRSTSPQPSSASILRTSKLDAAGTYTFHLTNAGEFEHALEIDGQGIEEETSVIGGGDSADVTVDLAEGEYEIYCPVGNHREMGMEGTLVVGAGGAGAGTGSDTTDDNTKTDDDTGTEDNAMGY